MSFPIRYCALCGVPCKAPAGAAPLVWQCEECHSLTIGIAAGAWQLGPEPAIRLPLDPSLGHGEAFAECGNCGAEVAVEISLRAQQPCSACQEVGRSLRQTPILAEAADVRLKAATLSDLEAAFLGAGASIYPALPRPD